MATPPDDEMITVLEAAKRCGRNPETVRRWIWSGKLPAEKLGNQLFVNTSIIDRFCSEITTELHGTERKKKDVTDPRTQNQANESVDVSQDIDSQVRAAGQKIPSEVENTARVPVPNRRSDVINRIRAFREDIGSRLGNLDIGEAMNQTRGND